MNFENTNAGLILKDDKFDLKDYQREIYYRKSDWENFKKISKSKRPKNLNYDERKKMLLELNSRLKRDYYELIKEKEDGGEKNG